MKNFLPETGRNFGTSLLIFFLFFNVSMGLSQIVMTDIGTYLPGDAMKFPSFLFVENKVVILRMMDFEEKHNIEFTSIAYNLTDTLITYYKSG
ncbi:hypothetical protein [Christiangramia salexigens]|uniref:Uncharacterized protein n=1 Tax=Christiangramia salexigens TaxID=1913577 RepID=A0A1L3J529_9FLAO|nr:hypothetical protein [Christiangramia salexigens]APG60237.1 hypothetical protein LPB144_07360 [Christiangramia salexigens]